MIPVLVRWLEVVCVLWVLSACSCTSQRSSPRDLAAQTPYREIVSSASDAYVQAIAVFCTSSNVDGDTGRTRVVAHLLNRGDKPILIYAPAFVGPEMWKRADVHCEPLPVTDAPLPAGLLMYDFVLLRPGSIYARQFVIACSPEEYSRVYLARCHYTVYEPGKEGHSKAVRAVIYPDRTDRPVRSLSR